MDPIEYGVCRLSLVPVRISPADQSEMVTQLLFGDDYQLLERSTDKKWCKIKITFDGYEGWIDARQHHAITQEYFEYIARAEFKITTDVTSGLLYNKVSIPIVIGSLIPITGAELFKMEEQFAFNGESKSVGLKRDFEFLKTIAMKYLQSPYLWGGKSPFGIDCSGFVQQVFKINGYRLLRDASQQASQGKVVPSFGDAMRGDVAFFKNAENRIVHTGILLEDHRIIHASGRVRIDQLDDQGIINSETGQHSHQLAHLRRFLT
jgi:gamma-D-glutamyl-L-lysine dipeptidyl-peptidase